MPVIKWRLVPVVPTPAMLDAAREAPMHGHPETASQRYTDIYAAMLEAAPQPPLMERDGQ